ncbi:MAG TPA: PilN domain-containing protein [Solirubrobacteraceae bacterium]
MKAVNLIPRDAQRSFTALRGLGVGTTTLLGALTVALVLVTSYVVMANNVNGKRDELGRVNAEVAAAQRQVSALKPYADAEQLRQSLLERVRSLAGGRFDWPAALSDLARAFPSDATLTDFDGSAGDAAAGPKVALSGCTPSHDAVARLIDRLRAVKLVSAVALQSSTIGEAGASAGCPRSEQFKLTVTMKGPAVAGAAAGATAPATAAPAATPATTSPATPTPAPATGGTP